MKRRLTTFTVAAVFLCPTTTFAQALGVPLSNQVFVRALVDGRASGPVPEQSVFAPLVETLKQQARDDGAIVIQAMRTVRFEHQPRCGRVVFALAQPSSHKAWPGLGAQLNICEDGQPPLRICADNPQVLVPPSGSCRDRSKPVDTAEVAAVIRAALAGGDLSPEQARLKSLRAPSFIKPAPRQ